MKSNSLIEHKIEIIRKKSEFKDRSIIRRYLPAARIAGPGLPGFDSAELIELLVADFLKTDHHPDIFTSFHFPYTSDRMSESPYIYQESYRRLTDVNFLDEQIRITKEVLEKMVFMENSE